MVAFADETTSITEAFSSADRVLYQAVRGVSDLINSQGFINVDFADIRTIMENKGIALMGTGVGYGERRLLEAAQQAVSSPLLDEVSISGARSVLINITGSGYMSIKDVNEASSMIQKKRTKKPMLFGDGLWTITWKIEWKLLLLRQNLMKKNCFVDNLKAVVLCVNVHREQPLHYTQRGGLSHSGLNNGPRIQPPPMNSDNKQDRYLLHRFQEPIQLQETFCVTKNAKTSTNFKSSSKHTISSKYKTFSKRTASPKFTNFLLKTHNLLKTHSEHK